MKKLICIIMAILTVMALAACGKTEIPDVSDILDISDTSNIELISEKTDSSTIDDNSEPQSIVSDTEEPSESSSSPQLSYPDIPTDYRWMMAYDVYDLAKQFEDLYKTMYSDEAQEVNAQEFSLYESVCKVIEDGYILNPSCGGIYAESEDHPKIEVTFMNNKTMNIRYYCRHDDTIWFQLDIRLPNEEMKNLINQYGVDGYRIYYSENKKPFAELSAEELASTCECEAVNIENIVFNGQTYEALKYKNADYSGFKVSQVTFLYEGNVMTLIYSYEKPEDKSTRDADEILDLVKLEKVYFNEIND